ncbi:MAG: hypothetical protein ACI3ZL_02745 [Candidatus Cryptobacteroides sp.]
MQVFFSVKEVRMFIEGFVKITPDRILSDRDVPIYEGKGMQLLQSAFKSLGTGYAKFYKMDPLCKLGFVASEILLAGEEGRFEPREDRAVVLMNSASCLADDRLYVKTVEDTEDYYPSPSVFVYTLPNIITGEIAIRNKYYGQTSFYVLPSADSKLIYETVCDAFQDRRTESVLAGWTECASENDFEAVIFLVSKDGVGFTPQAIEDILNR